MRHPADDLLLAYSAGALSGAEDLLVASHLSMCPRCERQSELLDAVGGAWLEPAPVSPPRASEGDDALAAMLSRLDEPVAVPAPPPVLSVELSALPLPAPLRDALARAGITSWQTLLPGFVQQIMLPIPWHGAPVRLTRVRGGFRVPRHTHKGRELNLVLAGGFQDPSGGYGPGDVADNDADVVHELAIDPGEDCLILAVNEFPLVPVGITAHIAQWLIGF